ncbi:hypothetical protein ACH4LK_02015 [Streptomyces lydicus]|uniref:hypothetical protein n=2 Tax=Streptomyces lydicus TaxID=47763 RepID=UPI003790DFB1
MDGTRDAAPDDELAVCREQLGAPSGMPSTASLARCSSQLAYRHRAFNAFNGIRGGEMWSGRHDDYFEQTARMIAEQLQQNRSRERAKAVKFSREQVEQSRKIAHDVQAIELERLAALGQIPPAEYKARIVALEEDADEGTRHDNPYQGLDGSADRAERR